MAVAYAFGNALVSGDELLEKQALGQLQTFMGAIGTESHESLSFSTGTAKTAEMKLLNADGDLIAPREIGIGKPLTVFIRNIYTGKYGGKDLLATTAVKGIGAYDAAPEAVNLLREKAEKNDEIHVFDADETGTPIVFYMQSLTKSDTVVTVKLDFQDFDDRAFQLVGQGASQLAGIPLFAPAQSWLMVGSLVVPAVGKLLESLFEKKYFFKQSESIFFSLPGSPRATEGFRLLMEDEAMDKILQDYRLSSEGQLVTKNGGGSYRGDFPYLVLALDGADREEQLADFQRTAATASILERFRPGGESSFPIDGMMDIVEASSDLRFRQRADRLHQKMEALPADDPGREKLKEQRDANIANVRNLELKRSYEG